MKFVTWNLPIKAVPNRPLKGSTWILTPANLSSLWVTATLMWIGGLGGLIVGLLLSTGLYGAKLAGFGVGHTGTGVILGLIPFIVVFLASALAFPSKGE